MYVFLIPNMDSAFLKDFTELRSAKNQLLDTLDRFKVSNRHDKKQIEEAKSMIEKAFRSFVNLDAPELDEKELQSTLHLLRSLSKGRHRHLLFRKCEDGSIIEEFTGHVISVRK